MAIGGRKSWLMLAMALAAITLAAAGCKTSPDEGKPKVKPEPTGPHASLLRLFPEAGDVTDWKAAGEVKIYGPVASPTENIEAVESDIPAGAALLKGYGYVKSATRKYTRGAQGAETVTVRVFEMKGPQDAFGIFSISSAGTQFPMVGLAARMSSSSLAFTKGSDFVTIDYTGANDPTPVLMEFARYAADQIASPGYRPAILESFPLGSQPGERYYLHSFQTLQALPFVPKGDPATMARMLSLTPETDVAIMGYTTEKPGVLNYLFVIHYANDEEAQAAFKAYEGYLMNSTNPAEHNIAIAPPIQAYLAGTFNAEENSVNDQLAKLLAGLGG